MMPELGVFHACRCNALVYSEFTSPAHDCGMLCAVS